MNLLLPLILAASLLPTLGTAATVTLNPTADAYVRDGSNASKNFGSTTLLQVQTSTTAGSNYDSYLKFDTSSASGQVASATLRLYASLSKAGNVGTSAHAVADTSWGETTIKWNNKPALGSALGSLSTTSTSYSWKEIDVTSYVQSERNAGRNVLSLGLHNAATSTVYVRASSRNASSNKPQLVIVSAPPNVPPTVSLSSPASGASFTAPASVTLAADAGDSDGSIARVEFYSGATLIGTDTTAPYSYSWTNVPAGSYSLTARAYDNLGAVTTSSAVTITVAAAEAHGVFYLYVDHLNTPRVITDSSNKVVWRWDSDAFGTLTANDDPDGDGIKFTYNLRFPGQYFDKETGLHYNYYRSTYDPMLGRYLEPDPIGLEGGLNLYSYVGGNSVSKVDPLGLFFQFSISQQSLTWVDPNTGGTSPSTTWPARSGPWRKGPLPEGWYELTPEEKPVKSEKRSMLDTCGNDYKFRLHPQFPTDRDGLLIHPDGGPPGTRGCIGAQGCTSSLRNFINSGIHGGGGLNLRVVP